MIYRLRDMIYGVASITPQACISSKRSFVYHQARKGLYIIKPTKMHTFGVMIYTAYAVMIYTASGGCGDDIPSPSAWIEKTSSIDEVFSWRALQDSNLWPTGS